MKYRFTQISMLEQNQWKKKDKWYKNVSMSSSSSNESSLYDQQYFAYYKFNMSMYV